MDFVQGIKVQFKSLVTEANGQSYIPWAAALAVAGRPQQTVALFRGKPAMSLLGGAVVAVDQGGQRTWLPILDARNNTVPADQLTSRDVGDTLNRARAKAIAMVSGVGLGLYAGFEDAAAFLRALNVRPDSDLTEVEPLVKKKGGKSGAGYVSWAAALAAARITDPTFQWEVIEYEFTDASTGEIVHRPYVPIGQTYMVGVKAVYQGLEHVEMLPVMGVVETEVRGEKKKRDHQPLTNPTAHDWNRAVMRCLAKAIAVVSGYGLNVYAKSDLDALEATYVGAKPIVETAAPEAIAELRNALAQSGRDEASLLQWLGKPDVVLEALSAADVARAMRALNPAAKAA
jgi:hypothetical protein